MSVLNYLKKIIPFNFFRNTIVLIRVDKLKHIEGYSKKRVEWLKAKIQNERIWSVPLKIDKKYHLVMDGQHRMEVAKLLQLKYVPCILYSYDDVDVWSLRKEYKVNSEIIISNFKKNIIFPYKTAKHRFPYGSNLLSKYKINELK